MHKNSKIFNLAYENTIAETIASGNVQIADLMHPDYSQKESNWEKWRLAYEAGKDFIEKYLQTFSKREEIDDFNKRKQMTYVPAFAKAAVNDVKDSIFQRIADVAREGGSDTYQNAIKGLNGGVDLLGSTMNGFIGRLILPELLIMGRVGVYVDMPQLSGNTIMDTNGKHPYIYRYKTEDIRNWSMGTTESGVEFNTLLLRDYAYKTDTSTGLPTDTVERYRFIWLENEKVYVQFFDEDSKPIAPDGTPGESVIQLNLSRIPFALFEISDSLMSDIADYQIALLNMASSDVSYVLKSNFPFYVEQFDPRSENLFQRPASVGAEGAATIVRPGEAGDSVAAKNQELKLGVASGRRVPKGLELPSFIHPSSEPLTASMMKQDELKRDIQILLKLTVTNLAPKMASAESKGYDERGLEAGLSAIGLELENGERNISRYWTLYEGNNGVIPTVKYPEKYSLQSDKERREEATDTLKTAKAVPSLTYKKEALKQVATTMLGTKISLETLNKIKGEIDGAKVIVSDPDELSKDIEQGIVSLDTASQAKNYPSGEVEKAAKDHAERVARIADSQGQARGTPELSGLGNKSKEEKQQTDLDPSGGTADSKTRGGAK